MAIADYPTPEDAARAGDPEALARIAEFVRAVTPIDQLIRQDYPQLAWTTNHPELGPLIQQAARERWDVARLQGALLNTGWWKATSANQREWARLQAEDPQSALQKFNVAAYDISNMARNLGVTLDPTVLQQMATQNAADGWDQARLTREVVTWAAGPNPAVGGQIGSLMGTVKNRAAQYFQKVDDATAFRYAQQILQGGATPDGFDAVFKNSAKARFQGDPTIVEAIDKGATAAQIFEPIRQQTAQLLEQSPDFIDFMDNKWSPIIDQVQTDGVRRPMSQTEAANYVRGMAEWRTTDNANKASSALGETILKTFGKVG